MSNQFNRSNNPGEQSNENGKQDDKEHFPNPFKDKEANETPLTIEEEAALEQQRREALTERD